MFFGFQNSSPLAFPDSLPLLSHFLLVSLSVSTSFLCYESLPRCAHVIMHFGILQYAPLRIFIFCLCFSTTSLLGWSCRIPEESESLLFLLFRFCDGGMSLQWNAALLASGVTVDGQSKAIEMKRRRGKMIGPCGNLQYSFIMVHSTHNMSYNKHRITNYISYIKEFPNTMLLSQTVHPSTMLPCPLPHHHQQKIWMYVDVITSRISSSEK